MTARPDDGLEVTDNAARQRYEARLGDRVAGFLDYRTVTGRVILIHTEVDPEFEGRGIGARLARWTLDDIRTRGVKVSVKCPFVAAWIARHPEYEDLRAKQDVTAAEPGR